MVSKNRKLKPIVYAILLIFCVTTFIPSGVFADNGEDIEIEPSRSSTEGGETIKIRNTGIEEGQSFEVSFGGVKAEPHEDPIIQEDGVDGLTIRVISPPYHTTGWDDATERDVDFEIRIGDDPGDLTTIYDGQFTYETEFRLDDVENVEIIEGDKVATADDVIVLTGEGFFETENHSVQVLINGVGVENADIDVDENGRNINVRVPLRISGMKSIEVINGDGKRGTLEDAFRYRPKRPVIDSISPSQSPIEEETEFVITGDFFLEGETQVYFGFPDLDDPDNDPNRARTIQVANQNELSGITPPISITGPRNVYVFIEGEVHSLKENFFTFISNPEIDVPGGLSPEKGSVMGGYWERDHGSFSNLIIRGKGFQRNALVEFGEIQADSVSGEGSEISVIPPQMDAPGSRSVRVTNPDGGTTDEDVEFRFVRSVSEITDVGYHADGVSALGGEETGQTVTLTVENKSEVEINWSRQTIDVYVNGNLVPDSEIISVSRVSEAPNPPHDYVTTNTITFRPPPVNIGQGKVNVPVQVVFGDGSSDSDNIEYVRSDPEIIEVEEIQDRTSTVNEQILKITKQENVTLPRSSLRQVDSVNLVSGNIVHELDILRSDLHFEDNKYYVFARIPEIVDDGNYTVRLENYDRGSYEYDLITVNSSNPEITSVENIDIEEFIDESEHDPGDYVNILKTVSEDSIIRITGKDISGDINSLEIKIDGETAEIIDLEKNFNGTFTINDDGDVQSGEYENTVIYAIVPQSSSGDINLTVTNPDGVAVEEVLNYVESHIVNELAPDDIIESNTELNIELETVPEGLANEDWGLYMRPFDGIRAGREIVDFSFDPDSNRINATIPRFIHSGMGDEIEVDIIVFNKDNYSIARWNEPIIYKRPVSQPTIEEIEPDEVYFRGGREVILTGTEFLWSAGEENFGLEIRFEPMVAGFEDVSVQAEVINTQNIADGRTEVTVIAPSIQNEEGTDFVSEEGQEDLEIRLINRDGGEYSKTGLRYVSDDNPFFLSSIDRNFTEISEDDETPHSLRTLRGSGFTDDGFDFQKITIRNVEVTDYEIVSNDTINFRPPISIRDIGTYPLWAYRENTDTGEVVRVRLAGGFEYREKLRIPDILRLYRPDQGYEEGVIASGPQIGGTEVYIEGNDFDIDNMYFQSPFDETAIVDFPEDFFIIHADDLGEGEHDFTHRVIVDIPRSTDYIGDVDLHIRNNDGGHGIFEAAFRYIESIIFVSDLIPSNALTEGGETIQARGRNFTENTTIRVEGFGADEVTNIEGMESTRMSFVVPTGVFAPIDRMVTIYFEDPDFGSDTIEFQLLAPLSEPNIDYIIPADYTGEDYASVSPAEVPASGGKEVIIIGQEFATGVQVYIDNALVPNDSVEHIGPERLRVVTPERFPGDTSVRIVNPDNEYAELSPGLIYQSDPKIFNMSPTLLPINQTDQGDNEVPVFVDGEDFETIRGLTMYYAHENDGVEIQIPDEDIRIFNENEIKFNAPDIQDTGNVKIIIENFDGGRVEGNIEYIEIGNPDAIRPTISSALPNQGPEDRPTNVTIRGSNFDTANGVYVFLGDRLIEEATVRSNNTIDIIAPPLPYSPIVAIKRVNVINRATGLLAEHPEGSEGTEYVNYTYIKRQDIEGTPVIEDVIPPIGDIRGGNDVIIQGQNFEEGLEVYFGGEKAEITNVGYDRILLVTPSHDIEGSVNVTVMNPGGGSDTLVDGFEYVVSDSNPNINNINPDRGSIYGNTLVTIEGTGFQEGAQVYFGGEPSPRVYYESNQRLSVYIPAYDQNVDDSELVPGEYELPVDVSVVNPDMAVDRSEDSFTYIVPESNPYISIIAPPKGTVHGGSYVEIVGGDFRYQWDDNAANREKPIVKIGGIEAEIQKIRRHDGEVLYDIDSQAGFVYTDNEIAERIVIKTPSNDEGFKDVVVENPDGGVAVEFDGFEYIDIETDPQIEAIEPNRGPVDGGTPVKIIGSGFVEGAFVFIGGSELVDLEVRDDETIVGITSPGQEGMNNVTVLNPDGADATLEDGFEYMVPESQPEITIIRPDMGPQQGGEEVEIIGFGFEEDQGEDIVPEVIIGFEKAEVEFISSNELNIVTASGPVGTHNVTVINPDGGQFIKEDGYTYHSRK